VEVNKLVCEEEDGKFLKLMKNNEYSMVELLKKALVRISLMSLILSFEPHHNTL
jgi:hypothetical protein